jgi:hypothetical protein
VGLKPFGKVGFLISGALTVGAVGALTVGAVGALTVGAVIFGA